MAEHSRVGRIYSMHMFPMLPKNGMYYKYWDEVTDEDNGSVRRRILPAVMSTKIMVQLLKKYGKPTKKNFDSAITQLFINAEGYVKKLTSKGKNASCDLEFWRIPKIGTIFERLTDKTTYRFAVKALEARDRWLERQSTLGRSSNNECETAKAIDNFNVTVQVSSVTSGLQNIVFDDFNMNSYMVDQFDPTEDTSEDESSDDEEGPEATAKHAQLEKAGSNIGFDSALVAGTAGLALGGDDSAGMDSTQDEKMGGTGDFSAFLAQLAKEDEAQLDEEDLMEIDGY